MKADSIQLVEFLSANKTLFKIPVYQRNYEWGTKQCDALFRDLETAIDNQIPHFLGTMVYVSQSGPHMSRIDVMIDGQQRLTSLMLFIKALCDSSNDDDLKLEIKNQFLINPYLSHLNHGIKLEQVDQDQASYQNVLHDQVNDQSETVSKIILNYQRFMHLIDESKYSVVDLYNGLSQFDMVYIELTNGHDEENPQTIFESLNSAGVSLTDSDLIRNFLLMRLPDTDQTTLYYEYWAKIQKILPSNEFNEFIHNYLTMRTSSSHSSRKLYDNYQFFFNQHHLDSKSALADLYEVSITYDVLNQAKTDDADVNVSLKRINALLNTIFYPYLLLIYGNYMNGNYTLEQLQMLLQLIENFAFRQRIVGTRKMTTTTIASLVKQIEVDGDLELIRLKRFFLQRSFPNDEMVRESLANRKLYWSTRSSYLVKQVLSLTESHFSKELVDLNKTQIEHIMPQKLSADWKFNVENAEEVNDALGDTIGNLTLTMYNQEMGNKPFSEKLKYYRDSNIRITRRVAENYDEWNQQTILGRSQSIADILINTFPMPKVDLNDLKLESSGTYNIADSVRVTGMHPLLLMIDDVQYKLANWPDLLVNLLNYLWEQDSNNFDLIKKDTSLQDRLFGGTPSSKDPRLENGMLFINSVRSANDVVTVANRICELFKITDDVSFSITK